MPSETLLARVLRSGAAGGLRDRSPLLVVPLYQTRAPGASSCCSEAPTPVRAEAESLTRRQPGTAPGGPSLSFVRSPGNVNGNSHLGFFTVALFSSGTFYTLVILGVFQVLDRFAVLEFLKTAC